MSLIIVMNYLATVRHAYTHAYTHATRMFNLFVITDFLLENSQPECQADLQQFTEAEQDALGPDFCK